MKRKSKAGSSPAKKNRPASHTRTTRRTPAHALLDGGHDGRTSAEHHARTTAKPAYTISPRNRYWEVRDAVGELVCLTVYRKGAREVVRRLAA